MTHTLLQSHDFAGRVALVTGASRGIGRATAEVLAGYGAHVALCARGADAAESVVAGIREAGGSAEAHACDVADFDAVESLVRRVTSERGRLDLLVNNAGVIEPLARLADSDPRQWALAVDVNLKGVYHGMRAALPRMIAAKGGTIVNISSGAADSALVGWSHYCGTKAAAKKLTEVAHREVAEHGVRVLGLSPGTVATDMMGKIRDSGVNAVSALDRSAHIPPEWAGEAVAYLFGAAGDEHLGTDFSIKTAAGRAAVGLPAENAPDTRGVSVAETRRDRASAVRCSSS